MAARHSTTSSATRERGERKAESLPAAAARLSSLFSSFSFRACYLVLLLFLSYRWLFGFFFYVFVPSHLPLSVGLFLIRFSFVGPSADGLFAFYVFFCVCALLCRSSFLVASSLPLSFLRSFSFRFVGFSFPREMGGLFLSLRGFSLPRFISVPLLGSFFSLGISSSLSFSFSFRSFFLNQSTGSHLSFCL